MSLRGMRSPQNLAPKYAGIQIAPLQKNLSKGSLTSMTSMQMLSVGKSFMNASPGEPLPEEDDESPYKKTQEAVTQTKAPNTIASLMLQKSNSSSVRKKKRMARKVGGLSDGKPPRRKAEEVKKGLSQYASGQEGLKSPPASFRPKILMRSPANKVAYDRGLVQ